MVTVLYNADGSPKKTKTSNLLGEVIQLFDTAGNETRAKLADAQLGAIEVAKMQLNQPAQKTSPIIYIAVVGFMVIILVVVILVFKKKKNG